MKADDLNWEKCAPFWGPWHHQMSSIYRKSIVIYDVKDYVIEIGAPKQNMFWKRLTKTKISLQLVQKQNSYDQKSCRKAWSCKKKVVLCFHFLCMYVCLSVCSQATGHSCWPRNFIFDMRDPYYKGKKGLFLFLEIFIFTNFRAIFIYRKIPIAGL